jgi:hypothetical protein
MNAQAIELYKQALEFAYTTIGKDHANTSYFQGTVAGKFAELIVQECQTVVEWAITVDSTIDRVPMLIKEHFGVEE